ncbi:MAG: hypothetical protein ACOWYE_12305 [Desulfatiglandales bacterium]
MELISGEKIIEKYHIRPIQLYKKIISTGIQPYDELDEEVPPPDVTWCMQRIKTKKDDARDLEKELEIALRNHQEELKSALCEIEFNIDLEVDIIKNKFESTTKELKELHEYLEKCRKRNGSDSLNSWKGFVYENCPQKMTSIEELKKLTIVKSLASASRLFLRQDIERHFAAKRAEEKGLKPSSDDIEAFVRNIEVAFESNEGIKIRLPGRTAEIHARDGLKFRNKSKEWSALIEMIHAKRPIFSVGASSNRRLYDARIKLLLNINSKLIDFLRTHYGLDFPSKFKLYEKDKAAGPGTYCFKFKTGDDSLGKGTGLEALDNDTLIKVVETLANKMGTPTKNYRYNDISMQFAEASNHAIHRRLLTKEQVDKLVTN